MEPTEKRQTIALYQFPQQSELEVKSLIIKALPQAALTPQHIFLRKKEAKFQAFVMVPANKVSDILAQKSVIINKENIIIKKTYFDAQVFVSRIPDNVTMDEIKTHLENQYGKIINIHEGQPHEETKNKLKHCYIQFEKDEDAEKFLFDHKKSIVKNFQLRPCRAYGMGEGQQTDKKVWIKVQSAIEDPEDLEKTLNESFSKEGKLREKIKIDNNIALVTYTNIETADRVLQSFKGNKIGKYDVILRPYAKDNYSVFVGGLRENITNEQIQHAFRNYQPLIACTITFSNNQSKNATVTFASHDAYTQLLVDYKEDPNLEGIFKGRPYITQHMTAKDRNDYNQFKKGKDFKKVSQPGPYIPPMAPTTFGSIPGQINFVPQNRGPVGFGFPNPNPNLPPPATLPPPPTTLPPAATIPHPHPNQFPQYK